MFLWQSSTKIRLLGLTVTASTHTVSVHSAVVTAVQSKAIPVRETRTQLTDKCKNLNHI